MKDLWRDIKAIFGFYEPLRVNENEKSLIVEALTMYYDNITPSKDNSFHHDVKILIRKVKRGLEP